MKLFYHFKERPIPEGVRPGTPYWTYFERLRVLLVSKNIERQWKTYIQAQFRGDGSNRDRVWPQMLCSERSMANFQSRVEYLKRRYGVVHTKELENEVDLGLSRYRGAFLQATWYLENMKRNGLTAVDAFKAFPHEFHPFFVLSYPGVWLRLVHKESGFSADVLLWFRRLAQINAINKKKGSRILKTLGALHEEACQQYRRRYTQEA